MTEPSRPATVADVRAHINRVIAAFDQIRIVADEEPVHGGALRAVAEDGIRQAGHARSALIHLRARSAQAAPAPLVVTPSAGGAAQAVNALQAVVDLVPSWARNESDAHRAGGDPYYEILRTARDALATIVEESTDVPPAALHIPPMREVQEAYDAGRIRGAAEATGRTEEEVTTDGVDTTPTVQVMNLPGGRYAVVLSNWPHVPPQEERVRFKEGTGADGLIIARHPVRVR